MDECYFCTKIVKFLLKVIDQISIMINISIIGDITSEFVDGPSIINGIDKLGVIIY